jgi:hypothetical protein
MIFSTSGKDKTTELKDALFDFFARTVITCSDYQCIGGDADGLALNVGELVTFEGYEKRGLGTSLYPLIYLIVILHCYRIFNRRT